MPLNSQVLGLLESISDTLIMLDREWRFTYVNRAALSVAQRSGEELLGRVIWEVYPQLLGSVYETAYREAMTQQRVVRFESQSTISERWYDLSVFPINDGILIYGREVSDRRRLEAMRSESHERVELLSDLARRLLADEHPQDLVNEVYRRLSAQLGLEVYFHFLLDDDGNGLTLAGCQGVDEATAAAARRLELGQAVCGSVARDQKPMVVSDVQHWDDPRGDLIRGMGLTAYCCHPLVAQGRLIGTLSFGTRRRTRFEADELSLMQMVCDQIAIAVHRRRTERALRQSEERHELAARAGKVGVWELDLATMKLHLAPNLKEMLGYSEEELPDSLEAWCALVHPDDKAPTIAAAEAHIEGRAASFQVEVRRRHKDGGYRWFLAQGTVLRDAEGRPLRLTGSDTDITDRKEAARALQESEARLRGIVEAAVDGIITIDQRGSIESINPAVEQIFGYAPHEVIGQNVRMLMPEPYHSEHDRYLENYHRTGEARIIGTGREVVGRRKSGETFPVDLAVSEVRLGERRLYTGIVRDITRRRRAEDALRQQHRLMQTITDNATAALFMMDASGRCTFMNPAAEAMTGYRFEEVKGRVLHDVVHHTRPDGRPFPVSECPIDRALPSNQRIVGHEDLFVRRDGSLFPVLCAARPIVEDGVPMGTVIEVRDLTQEKRADEELRIRAQVLRSMSEGVSLADESGIILYTNPAEDAMFGYEPGEMVGKHVTVQNSYSHEENARIVGSVIEQLKTRGAWTGEFANVRKDGTPFITRARITALDMGGKRYWVCVQEDITEQKRAEVALRESEQRFRLMADSAPVLIWLSDTEKRGVFFNRPWLEFTGRSLEQELGHGWFDALHPDDRPDALETCATAFAQRRPFTTQFRLRRHDGEYRWFLDTGVPRYAADGSFAGYIGSCIDITEQKRAEEELLRTNQTLQAIVEASPVGIMALDRDGRVLLWNPGSERTFGWKRHEVLGRENPIVPAGRRDEFLGKLRQTLAGQPLTGVETVRQRKDGSLVDVAIWTAPLGDGRGQADTALAVIADISDRKRAEEALRALNETLEERVAQRTNEAEHRAAQLRALASELTLTEQRERRRLATVLHDELAQSLAISKMKLSLVPVPKGEERGAKAIQDAKDAIGEAIRHTRSLMQDLSPPMLYDLGLGAALEGLAERMEHHELRVTVEMEGDEPPLPEDLRTYMFQAVRELLMNVLKYAQVHEARVTLATISAELRVTVSDEGVGFDPVALTWRPTQRGGFGLFSIRERLELLGGRLEVDSAPGMGTRVTLAAPVRPPTAAAPAAPEDAAAAGDHRHIRVMLVDDHEILRQGLAGLLREQPGIEVVGQASDGEEAVELALRLRPDVIVMDASMPRMNGLEATRRVRAALPSVRVVGLSMHDTEAAAAAMVQAGATSYLTKGGPSEQLIAAIRACAEASAPVAGAAPAPVAGAAPASS